MMTILGLLLCSACSPNRQQKKAIDELNGLAYAQRYRNVDSTRVYANRALVASKTIDYKEGIANAYLNKAFYDIVRMNYNSADTMLNHAESAAKSNITKLDVSVFRMRLCQRRAQNKDFYFHKGRADRLIEDIRDNITNLSDADRAHYTFSKSEYGIVLSTYLYYVNLSEESSDALLDIYRDNDITLINDTAQYLGYLYNIGSGGIIRTGSYEDIKLQEFDYLMQCYMLSKHSGHLYWEANSLQALAECLVNPEDLALLKLKDAASLRYLNDFGVSDSLLAGNLALRALDGFVRYGDVYQTAASRRTLAKCYQYVGDRQAELDCLLSATDDFSTLKQAPAILASLDERLSMAYSEFDDKHMSDSCRNAYLDIQDSTRQDRQLEARAEFLDHLVKGTRFLLGAIIVLIVIMAVVITYLIRYRRMHKFGLGNDSLLLPLEKLAKHHDKFIEDREDEIDELEEQLSALNIQIDDAQRVNIEQHAKVSFVQAIMPLIDRMLHSIKTLHDKDSDDSLIYIAEVCNTIHKYNEGLTKWIQLRKGQISLHIETFQLQEILEIVRLSEKAFSKKGIILSVTDTNIILKADKALTLFLINTIADNARKFTPCGGTVKISVTSSAMTEGYADISIEDTGNGMTQQQAEHLFDYKAIDNSEENLSEQKSHGFGLMNCRGIIDRYKKTSSLFSQCFIKAESQEGKGTKIHFQLPMVSKVLMLIMVFCISFSAKAKNIDKASIYADSVWQCNVNGEYMRALEFADSCLHNLNVQYLTNYEFDKTDTLTLNYNGAELRWLNNGIKIDYIALRDVRNEVAVASLALHKWDLYESNNKSYARLYTELSKDTTLNTFCVTQENTEMQINVYIVILIALIIILLFVFWYFYLRYVVHHRNSRKKVITLLKILDFCEGDNDTMINERKGRALSLLTDKMISNCSEEMRKIAVRIRKQIEHENEAMKLVSDRIESLEVAISKLRNERDKLHVCNSIIDNTLSALKHETMYYPAHIANSVKDLIALKNEDSTDSDFTQQIKDKIQELNESITFYRSLYSVLAVQCSRNLKDIKYYYSPLTISKSDNKYDDLKIVANKALLDYLLVLLKRKNDKELPFVDYDKYDANYALMHIQCPNIKLTEEQCANLFTLTTHDVDFLIIRQILREIGDASNSHRTGIRVQLNDDNVTEFFILLPLAL